MKIVVIVIEIVSLDMVTVEVISLKIFVIETVVVIPHFLPKWKYS